MNENVFRKSKRGSLLFKENPKKIPKKSERVFRRGVVLRVKVTDIAVKHNLIPYSVSLLAGSIRGEFLYLLLLVYPSHHKQNLSINTSEKIQIKRRLRRIFT